MEDKPFNLNTLGHRLRYLRTYNHTTVTKMAEKLGVAFQTISQYECNVHMPLFPFLEKIVKVTGCNANWLLTGEGKVFQESRTGTGDEEKGQAARLAERIQEDPVLKELFERLAKYPDVAKLFLMQMQAFDPEKGKCTT